MKKALLQDKILRAYAPSLKSQYPGSGTAHPGSNSGQSVSGMGQPISSIQYPASSIEQPATSIQYRVSSIEHPASGRQVLLCLGIFFFIFFTARLNALAGISDQNRKVFRETVQELSSLGDRSSPI
jgi:hypothetical protein